MRLSKTELGRLAESAAEKYLVEQGYEVIERNYYCPFGEIDIIAREGGTLCFVEVRSKTTDDQGHPLESITRAKRRRLVSSVYYYLKARAVLSDDIRIDVLAVTRNADNLWEMEHIPNAVAED